MTKQAEINDENKLEDHLASLCVALNTTQTQAELRNFLVDLCTPAELRSMAERWHVAKLLDQGTQSYREINTNTGVSTTTISRVARFLTNEPHQGYRTILDRLKGQ